MSYGFTARHALTIQRFGCREACARAPAATAGTHDSGAQSRAAMRATHLLHQRIQKSFPESLQRLPQRRFVVVLVLQNTCQQCAGLKCYTSRTSGASLMGGGDVSRSFSSFSKWATVGTACGADVSSRGKRRTYATVAHHGIKIGSQRRINRNADAAGLGMHTERCFEQVVHVLGHLNVKPRERVSKHDLILRASNSERAERGVPKQQALLACTPGNVEAQQYHLGCFVFLQPSQLLARG